VASPLCPLRGRPLFLLGATVPLAGRLAVPYRHLIFTIPWQLRLLIKDNRQRLEGALFRPRRTRCWR
jgi:hypothetical protein